TPAAPAVGQASYVSYSLAPQYGIPYAPAAPAMSYGCYGSAPAAMSGYGCSGGAAAAQPPCRSAEALPPPRKGKEESMLRLKRIDGKVDELLAAIKAGAASSPAATASASRAPEPALTQGKLEEYPGQNELRAKIQY